MHKPVNHPRRGGRREQRIDSQAHDTGYNPVLRPTEDHAGTIPCYGAVAVKHETTPKLGWFVYFQWADALPNATAPNAYCDENSGRRRPSCSFRRFTMLECIWLTRDSDSPSVVPISFIVSSS